MQRLLAVLVFALAVVGHLGVAVGEEPTSATREAGARAGCACKEKCKQCAEKSKCEPTAKVEGRQYSVTCRVVEGGEQAVREQAHAVQLVVVEGMKAKLGSSQCPKQGECPCPKKQCPSASKSQLPTENTSIELTVTPLKGSRVQLDARVEKRSGEGADMNDCPFQPAAIAPADRVAESNLHVHRSVRAMTLGETVTIAYGCQSCDGESSRVIELTVHEVDVPAPGITPIPTATAEKTEESGEYYTAVYSVGDMLAPYAIHKEGAAVENADFLPIIEMLLTDTGCNWTSKAEIRPYAKNVALIITQTAEGHKKVSNFLSAKRASVDVLQEQIRR